MTDPPPLIEGQDYTVDDRGRYVFTAAYLLARGRCCASACQNCPYPKPPAGQIENPVPAD